MAKDVETVIETINVAEITEHASKKSNKKYWKAITTDGEYYTIWKQDVKDRIMEGINTVSLEINDTGDMVFKNVVGIAAPPQVDGGGYLAEMGAAPPPQQPAQRPAQAAPAPAAPPVSSQPLQQPQSLTPTQQARAISLQVAGAMVASGVIPTTELMAMSERNLRYILSGAGEQNSSSRTTVPAADYVER
jgi:hypothetical protein